MKNNPQTLICWIGDTDLLVFGKYGRDYDIPLYSRTAHAVWESDKGDSHNFNDEVDKLDLKTRNSSIILTIRDALRDNAIPAFETLILLTNRPRENKHLLGDFRKSFASFLKKATAPSLEADIKVLFVPDQDDPTRGVDGWNYEKVYRATKGVLNQLIEDGLNPDTFWYNITPGTIAQSTSLILLGKELSRSSNFIQVEKSRQRVDHCNIPFDINAAIDQQAAHVESGQYDSLIGSAPSFMAVLKKAGQIAKYPITVLLTGPSGTGKEEIAKLIHNLSRPEGKFVAVNCAMLSRETGVTELTGFWRGAYTDAKETRLGKFHEAIGGTLFLDEIGDCPLDVQAELLRFLQPSDKTKPSLRTWELKGRQPKNPEGIEKKLSGTQTGDIRIIAATHKNLLAQDTFRQDLYYRLETIQIKLPSLEQRKAETGKGVDDIKQLATHFLALCNSAYSKNCSFTPEAIDALRQHTWKGNVRELYNVVTRCALLAQSDSISGDDIKSNLTSDEPPTSVDPAEDFRSLVANLARSDIENQTGSLGERISEFANIFCKAAYVATGGNKKQAYTILHTDSRTFDKYLNLSN